MSFKEFYKDETINEQKVHSFKYTERLKNFKELSIILSKFDHKLIFFETKDSRTIEVFKVDQFIGNIKDKGKVFEVDASIFKQLNGFKQYLEKEL